MAAFAVSGSVVVFLAMQVHKRLLSNFMKKMEFEIGHATGPLSFIHLFCRDVLLEIYIETSTHKLLLRRHVKARLFFIRPMRLTELSTT